MSSAVAGSICLRPAIIAGNRRVSSPRKARAARVIVASAAEGDHSVGRREALKAVLLSGLAASVPRVNAEELPEVPEPAPQVDPADIPEVPEPTPRAVTEDLPEVPKPVQASQSPALDAADPKVLGGGAAVVAVTVAAIAAGSSQSGDAEATPAVQSSTVTAAPPKKSFEAEAELEEAEAESKKCKEKLAALRAEFGEISITLTQASAAQGATSATLATAVSKTAVCQAELTEAKNSLDSLKAEYDEATSRGLIGRLAAKLTKGTSVSGLKAKVASAETDLQTAVANAAEASAADRRAWIANWRALDVVRATQAKSDAKSSEIVVVSALVEEAERAKLSLMKQLGIPLPVPEETSEERVKDRQAWIAAWRARSSTAAPVDDAASSNTEAKESAEDRVKDRQAWIAAWRAKSTTPSPAADENVAAPSAAAISTEESAEDRVKDRQAWIAAWRAKALTTTEESTEDRLKDRQEWIAAWRVRTQAKEVVNA